MQCICPSLGKREKAVATHETKRKVSVTLKLEVTVKDLNYNSAAYT